MFVFSGNIKVRLWVAVCFVLSVSTFSFFAVVNVYKNVILRFQSIIEFVSRRVAGWKRVFDASPLRSAQCRG